MKQYEYVTVPAADKDGLRDLGRQGWRVVRVLPTTAYLDHSMVLLERDEESTSSRM